MGGTHLESAHHPTLGLDRDVPVCAGILPYLKERVIG